MAISAPMLKLLKTVLACLCVAGVLGVLAVPGCHDLFKTEGTIKRNSWFCRPEGEGNFYYNLPILDGVYCFNNGTGICKAFAGRFEFYFNVWTQTFLGPAGASEFVSASGYHKRKPQAYMVDGRMMYADRAINWSRNFTRNKPSQFNLLSATSFNWCKYATTHNWPYKSAILDHDGVHQIFFFNRQSCIYNPKTKDLVHYNTRFLHKSNLRIDLDYNPTIFSMEDNLANQTRLVKHKRQHWFELNWTLLKDPKTGLKYFVEMDREERQPQIIQGKGPLLSHKMYRNTSELCVSDYLGARKWGEAANARLVHVYCGLDSTEISILLEYLQEKEVYELGLHSIPRYPLAQQYFYGVNVFWDSAWERFASDGYSFSATTTIPLGNDRFEVVSFFSYYKDPNKQAQDVFDEHYPPTYLSRYTMHYFWGWQGLADRSKNMKLMPNLNYVDDIAYLEKCNTILVIFGPLYTEFPRDQIDANITTPLGSIYDLGLNEMTSAFFAKDNKIYFYLRLNYLAEATYTCGNPRGQDGAGQTLVTAVVRRPYMFRAGPKSENWFRRFNYNWLYSHYEERHFQLMKMFTDTRDPLPSPEAPDADQFPWDDSEPYPEPETGGVPSSVYYLVALGILVLLAMLIVGFLVYRHHRIRKRRLLMTQRSELPDLSRLNSATPTDRSALVGRARPSGSQSTKRSRSLVRVGTRPTTSAGTKTGTKRSSNFKGSHRSSARTARSKLPSRSRSSSRSRRSK